MRIKLFKEKTKQYLQPSYRLRWLRQKHKEQNERNIRTHHKAKSITALHENVSICYKLKKKKSNKSARNILAGKRRVSRCPTGSARYEMSALELRLRQNARLRPPLALSASGQADKTRRRRNWQESPKNKLLFSDWTFLTVDYINSKRVMVVETNKNGLNEDPIERQFYL